MFKYYVATTFILFFLTSNHGVAQNNVPNPSDSDLDCCSSTIPSRVLKVNSVKNSFFKGKDSCKMVLVEGGVFRMGSNNFQDAQPIHEVEVSSFYIDEHEVTNRQFEQFVKETGYITLAERELNPKDFPGVDPSILVPGSAVFVGCADVVDLQNHLQWWDYVPGASWRNPDGTTDKTENWENLPVTQVAYEDAEAYAKWAGKRLPTEAEWEYAAKANKHTDETYYWGNEKLDNGKWMANIYQGTFPKNNIAQDGFVSVAPVKSFPANAFGLYDMEGNVWEWCSDYYRADYYKNSKTINPKGPSNSHDPQEPGLVKRVQRGGSFLCNDDYCERYKAGARGKGEVNSPTNNVGFRCVKDL